MIKANELRIGNWVIANGLFEGKRVVVEQIGSRESLSEDYRVLLFKDLVNGEFVKDCEPVKLSAEILVNAGFEKDGFNQLNISVAQFDDQKKKLFFTTQFDYLYLSEGDQDKDLITIWNKDLMKNFYVHQLQNLYFALTGKELELTIGGNR